MENAPEPINEDAGGQIAGFHDEIKNIRMEGYERGVKKARNALFWAAGSLVLGFLISLAQVGVDYIGYLLLLFGPLIAIFVALAFWTKKKPFTAIVVGLIVFFAFWIGFSILDPVNIFAGIIIKIFILVALVTPLKDAKELQRVKEERSV